VDHFVGRTGELAILDAELRAVRAGQPRVVLVEGEAGIGKSSLLSRFVSEHRDVCLLRASGDEAEMLLAWGLADQLLAGAGPAAAAAVAEGSWLAARARKDADAMTVGAQLVGVLGDLQAGDQVIVVVVDDLHWSDRLSAQALLFALRRMQADRVLGLVSTRPGELSRLGEGWSRFAGGDHRVTRVRLAGLSAEELAAMAAELGAGELSGRAVAQLLDHTGGNALHCRALLEELGPGGLARAGDDLPAPRELAGVVLARLKALSGPAQGLVTAAAVLGRSCPLAAAAALAGLGDPLAALDEAADAGLLVEERTGSGATIAFAHPLVHAAVRDDLGPARRRRLHQAAAALVSGPAVLAHRVAAAVGPDEPLAADLEEAARQAAEAGEIAQGAAWLAQASGASTDRARQERRLLDAVAALTGSGDVSGALALWPQAMRPWFPLPAGTGSWPALTSRRPGPRPALSGPEPGLRPRPWPAPSLAPGLTRPFQLALLERDDGRRLRRAGDRSGAVTRLRQARDHLAALGAQPHVAACERELAHCGAEIRPEQAPAWNLTASELAVARLVSTGRSNREVASELYVSVKAVEFHLGHVYDKIGIRSRKDLAARLAAPR
jgi:ATP/maltotriose-dependent transcriptional regulator MalT